MNLPTIGVATTRVRLRADQLASCPTPLEEEECLKDILLAMKSTHNQEPLSRVGVSRLKHSEH